MTVHAYIRVSTAGQVESGLGLAAQRDRIQAYCRSRWPEKSIAYHEDHCSADAPYNRPAFSHLQDLLEKIDHLVVLRLDRLARNTIDLLTIVRSLDVHHVTLHSVCEAIDTQGPAGKLFLAVLAACGQFERDLIRQRTREALAAKRAKGGRVGRAPLGFTGDPLEIDPKTIHLALAIHDLRAQGKSLRAISNRLSVPLPTVRYVLSNPIYRDRGLL
jgi:site-specific DNA recombinase